MNHRTNRKQPTDKLADLLDFAGIDMDEFLPDYHRPFAVHQTVEREHTQSKESPNVRLSVRCRSSLTV